MLLLELSQYANYLLGPDTYIAIGLVFVLIASMQRNFVYVFEVIIVSILGTYGTQLIGEATLSAIFFFMAAYYLSKMVKDRIKREIIFFIATFLALFGGLARVILKVHYLSGVLAGFAFGIAICLFSILITEHLSFHGKRLFKPKKRKYTRRNITKTAVSKA